MACGAALVGAGPEASFRHSYRRAATPRQSYATLSLLPPPPPRCNPRTKRAERHSVAVPQAYSPTLIGSVSKLLGGFFTFHEDTKGKRADILNKLFSQVEEANYDSLLDPSFRIRNVMDPCAASKEDEVHSKEDWMAFLFGSILPAVPDFSWSSKICDIDIDMGGFCVVSVQANGHHTGRPLQLGNLPSLDASGAHFCLPSQLFKVKIDTHAGTVTEIEVLPKAGASVIALYTALGGAIPDAMVDYSLSKSANWVCMRGLAGLGPL